MNNSFFLGSTITFIINITQNGTPTDPVSAFITCKNTKGGDTPVLNQTMYKRSTGIWYYVWTSSEIGNFNVSYAVSDGVNITISKDSFTVTP